MIIFLRLFLGFLLQTVPFAALCLYPFKRKLRLSVRHTVAMTLAVILLLDILFTVSGCYLNIVLPPDMTKYNSVNIVFLLCLIPCFIWVLYASLADWRQKLFIYSFTLTSALIITSIANTILAFLPSASSDGLPYGHATIPVLLAVTVLFFPVLLMIIKYRYMPISVGVSQKEEGYLAILSLLLFFVIAGSLVFMNYDNITNTITFGFWITQLLLIFVIYSFVFKMISLSHERFAAQLDSANLNHQVEILEEQHLRFNNSIEKSRQMRHDLKHHLLTVRGYLINGENNRALDYLNEYINVSEEYEIPKICNIGAINWILNYYQSVAKENEIDLKMRVSVPESSEFAVKDSDMAVLLGNLMENAVTGARSAPAGHRFIRLNIIRSGKMLVITVDNGFDGTVKRAKTNEGGAYLSTKEGHTGIDIKSITNIASKYCGGCEFKDSDSVFSSSVMLHMQLPS